MFKKHTSVFKQFKEDNLDTLDKAFFVDWNYSKIHKFVKDEADVSFLIFDLYYLALKTKTLLQKNLCND